MACTALYNDARHAWLTKWDAGTWAQNKRKGIFKIVDGEGCLWTEKYDDDGKRTLRKKVLMTSPLSLLPFSATVNSFRFLVLFGVIVLFCLFFLSEHNMWQCRIESRSPTRRTMSRIPSPRSRSFWRNSCQSSPLRARHSLASAQPLDTNSAGTATDSPDPRPTTRGAAACTRAAGPRTMPTAAMAPPPASGALIGLGLGWGWG